MPPTKSPLVALIHSLLISACPCASALQVRVPTANTHRQDQNPIANVAVAHRHQHLSRHRTRHRRHGALRRGLGMSSRRGPGDDSPESDGRKGEDSDGEDEDEGFVNASDLVDFERLGKRFDDVPEYGVIRSLESPHENYDPVDPPSAEEIQLWMEKNDSQRRKQRKQRAWRRMFPWVSPLASLVLPRRHAPSLDNRNSVNKRTLRSTTGRRHSNFGGGPSSPRLLRGFLSTPDSVRNLLVALNAAAFAYQIVTAVRYLPGFNRVLAASVAGDAYSAAALNGGLSAVPQWTPREVVLRALGLVGGGAGVVIASGARMTGSTGRIVGRGPIAAHSMGPFFLDYAHQPYPLSHFQKHRYISSGFLHGSLLHLGMNLRALLSLPSWLENGIGKGVYLSSYLGAIVTGNIAHSLTNMSGRAASELCVGASGGICGLYGLMLASLMKMGNADATYYVLKQMVWLLGLGFLVPNISNAAHLGGFAGGWLVGFLFGPGYERSYALNRADGAGRDSADVEFRQMMGQGIYPSIEKAFFPLKYLWWGIGLAVLAKPDLRPIPISLLRGILEPGATSGTRALLRP